MQSEVRIKNKRAKFDYELLDKFQAGIQLLGTEIKSIRQGKASISESFCQFKDGELFIVNMFIDEYTFGTHFNHKTRRERKLLLTKIELKKLHRKVENTGLTIVPNSLYINKKGLAKLEVFLARGKKNYDKRHSLKEKDFKRDLARKLKNY